MFRLIYVTCPECGHGGHVTLADGPRDELARVRGERDRLAAAVVWLASGGTVEGIESALAEVIDTLGAPLVPIPGLAATLATHDLRHGKG